MRIGTVLAAITTAVSVMGETPLREMDFENTIPGKIPAYWSRHGGTPGFDPCPRVTNVEAATGEHAVLFDTLGKGPELSGITGFGV